MYYLPQCVGVKSTEKMEEQAVRHRAMGMLCRPIGNLVWKVKLILSECSKDIYRKKLDKLGGCFFPFFWGKRRSQGTMSCQQEHQKAM